MASVCQVLLQKYDPQSVLCNSIRGGLDDERERDLLHGVGDISGAADDGRARCGQTVLLETHARQMLVAAHGIGRGRVAGHAKQVANLTSVHF